MFKLFEMIGALMATTCLLQIVSSPTGVLKEIRQGPVPHLASFDRKLQRAKSKQDPRRHANIRRIKRNDGRD